MTDRLVFGTATTPPRKEWNGNDACPCMDGMPCEQHDALQSQTPPEAVPTVSDDGLLPCPFCGDAPAHGVQSQFGREFWVQCDCKSEGVIFTTPAEAIAAWNRRASAPDAPPPSEALAYEAFLAGVQECADYYEEAGVVYDAQRTGMRNAAGAYARSRTMPTGQRDGLETK